MKIIAILNEDMSVKHLFKPFSEQALRAKHSYSTNVYFFLFNAVSYNDFMNKYECSSYNKKQRNKYIDCFYISNVYKINCHFL